MIIYLIRHGQTTGDVEDRYGGDYEDHLTDLGKQEAEELSEKLAAKGIEKIFVSPRIRAQETARIIDEKLNIGYETIDNLRERNHYGILTGQIKSDAKQRFPEETEKVRDYRTCAKGGEEYPIFLERLYGVLDLIGNYKYETVAVITHGGLIRAIFREVLKKGEIKLEDCAYAVIMESNNKYLLLSKEGIELQ